MSVLFQHKLPPWYLSHPGSKWRTQQSGAGNFQTEDINKPSSFPVNSLIEVSAVTARSWLKHSFSTVLLSSIVKIARQGEQKGRTNAIFSATARSEWLTFQPKNLADIYFLEWLPWLHQARNERLDSWNLVLFVNFCHGQNILKQNNNKQNKTKKPTKQTNKQHTWHERSPNGFP